MKIKLATASDKSAIRKFIKVHWPKKNHIFSRNESFFDYEMCPLNKPNFVIALQKSKIIGVLGFTTNRNRIKNSDLFLVMFRVIKSNKSYTVGVKLINFASKLTTAGIHTIGANKKMLPYYKFLGFRVGWLDHYYWLNSNLKVQKLFNKKKYPKKIISKKRVFNKNESLTKLDAVKLISKNFDKYADHKLAKSKNFFIYRYLQHPIYRYSFYQSRIFKGIGVIRKVNVKGFIGWKIIDWFGELEYFDQFCKLLIKTANQCNVAFVDLYVSGISKEKIRKTGLKKISNSVIIPNYLEPLVFENIKISFVTSCKEEIFLVRGNGDQDRPS